MGCRGKPKRVFFVVAPESVGNHLVRRLFCECGCYGQYDYVQQIDYFTIENKKKLTEITTNNNIVYGKSAPASGKFYDFSQMANKFKNYGYSIVWVVPVRSYYYTAKSKERRKMCDYSTGLKRMLSVEYHYVFKQINKVVGSKLWVVPYVNLLDYNLISKELKELFGLKLPQRVKKILKNANKKYK